MKAKVERDNLINEVAREFFIAESEALNPNATREQITASWANDVEQVRRYRKITHLVFARLVLKGINLSR